MCPDTSLASSLVQHLLNGTLTKQLLTKVLFLYSYLICLDVTTAVIWTVVSVIDIIATFSCRMETIDLKSTMIIDID